MSEPFGQWIMVPRYVKANPWPPRDVRSGSQAEIHALYDLCPLRTQKRTFRLPLSSFATLCRRGCELTENKYPAADSGWRIFGWTTS
jgi:hypothetical protein